MAASLAATARCRFVTATRFAAGARGEVGITMLHISLSRAPGTATNDDDHRDRPGRRRCRWPRDCGGLVRGALAAGAILLAAASPAAAQTSVLTHHYDVGRSGWNATETVLTPNVVATPGPQGTFGLLATVPLDGYVDAQPLVVPGVAIV